ncbi:hypothetical protein [Brunnivagina elsteri]|uniref:hypothetical protein n=1 Tax=Brunnivagina elsteri TaxID=1247191 RepID=UPI0011776EE6|nr:hypothetical protein [Calothrix elsteri]
MSAAPTPALAQTIRSQDITKQRVTKWLTFDTKDWEDVFFSAIVHLSVPMFATSILLSAEGIAKLLIVPYVITVIALISVAAWLIRQFPEMQALVWGRGAIVVLGAILGGAI